MRIALAGSSGLIGSQVCRLAEAAGHQVVRLSRTDGVDWCTWLRSRNGGSPRPPV